MSRLDDGPNRHAPENIPTESLPEVYTIGGRSWDIPCTIGISTNRGIQLLTDTVIFIYLPSLTGY